MGIIRAVTEGSFSPEERARVIDATEAELRSMSEFFPEEDRGTLSEAITALRAPNKKSENFLRDTLGDRIRFGAEMMTKTAPTEDMRNTQDAQRETMGQTLNPAHLWLKNHEAREICNRLMEILDSPKTDFAPDPVNLFYSIGALQRLLTIIEKLRTPIDDGRIRTGERTTDKCIETITAARDSILQSLIPYDQETATSGVPDFDPALLNTEAIEDAADISGWLDDVKMRSV